MIWLTWRQFRIPALIVLAALVTGMVALAVTGPQLAELLRTSGQTFFSALSVDQVKKSAFYVGTALVYAIPALVGVFWGAPMVAREVEAGTTRLVWTQSVTRSRWLATKLGVTAACAAIAGTTGLALTWWCGPIDDAITKGYGGEGDPFAIGRITPALFGTRGTVPIGMSVLALAIGVTAGMVLRRTVAAMAVTLVLVVAMQLVMPLVVQQRLLEPKQLVTTISQDDLREVSASGKLDSPEFRIERIEIAFDSPGAWVVHNRTYDAAGNVVETFPSWVSECMPRPGKKSSADGKQEACFDRLRAEGFVQRVDYQPASRFWPLQLIETGILLGLAALLGGFCLWRVRRDLT